MFSMLLILAISFVMPSLTAAKTHSAFVHSNRRLNSSQCHHIRKDAAGLPSVHASMRQNSQSPSSLYALADDGSITRRNWIRDVSIGTVATAIVGNGFAVQGPEPYIPAHDTLDEKVILITGGNTGLGLESAKRLAAAGSTVILTSRSVSKGENAVKEVQDYVLQRDGNENAKVTGKVFTLPLDLCDFQSIRDFPDRLQKILGGKKIDILMNNAGVMAIPTRELTVDQFERTFQTNHLGHFALTSLLLPMMNVSDTVDQSGNTRQTKARIINVASMAYLIAALSSSGLQMTNLNGEIKYDPWDAYGKSKLENILFTKELQRRVDAKGIPLEVVSLHPGAVRTDLARYIIGEDKYVPMEELKLDDFPLLDKMKILPALYFTKSVRRGATCQIWLAAGQGNNVAGKFYQNCEEVKLAPAALDMNKAKELWDASESMSGFHFNL